MQVKNNKERMSKKYKEMMAADKDLVNNLSKVDLKKLLELACKDSIFMFDGVYYRQKDGVAMGSPLGPTLANIFMCYHEKKWLEECPASFKPKYYRRYVDDIFVLFETAGQLNEFKNYLNSKHDNINFTSDIEKDGKLPFLDMLVDRSGGQMITSIYRKPTFTGVYSHFTSFLPSKYKFGLLTTLLFRYFSLSSTFELFQLEVIKLKMIFLRNGYPYNFIDACVTKFVNKIYVKKILKDDVPYINVDHVRDFIHVDDIMSAIGTLMKNKIKKRKVIDIGTGLGFNLLDILSHLNMEVTDKRMGTMYERKDNTAKTGFLRELGWEPKVNLLEYLEGEKYGNI